jgi:hypothetical protein
MRHTLFIMASCAAVLSCDDPAVTKACGESASAEACKACCTRMGKSNSQFSAVDRTIPGLSLRNHVKKSCTCSM